MRPISSTLARGMRSIAQAILRRVKGIHRPSKNRVCLRSEAYGDARAKRAARRAAPPERVGRATIAEWRRPLEDAYNRVRCLFWRLGRRRFVSKVRASPLQ